MERIEKIYGNSLTSVIRTLSAFGMEAENIRLALSRHGFMVHRATISSHMGMARKSNLKYSRRKLAPLTLEQIANLVLAGVVTVDLNVPIAA